MRLLVLIVVMVLGTALNASEFFPPQQRISERELHLRAWDAYRVGYFWKVFDIALYESDPVQEDVFALPLYLEIRYNRALSGERLAKTGREILHDLKGGSFMKKWAQPLGALDMAYADVSKGDRYGIFYAQEKGLVLYRNHEEVLAVQDPEFARAYLDIWLGGHDKTEGITKTLLEGVRQR